MIDLRIYGKQDQLGVNTSPANGEKKADHLYVGDNWNTAFWHIMCPTLIYGEEAEKPPFRDAESVQFLKDSYDVVFADDEDWYSVICEGVRMNIACLNKALICGLGMIYDSKRGRYSWLTNMDENVWRALGSLPMTVKVAVREEFLSEWHSFFHEAEFRIVNYPLGSGAVEVNAVKAHLHNNAAYTEVPHTRLYTDKNGAYYINNFNISDGFEYRWEKDIDGILSHIDFKWGRLKCLEEFSRTYDIFELGLKLENDEFGVMFLQYPHLLKCAQPNWDDAEDVRSYEKFVKELQETDDYKEYLYFRDVFRVVNHMLYIPEVYSRRLVMLMVDKASDGTYKIHDELTFKNPNFAELIQNAIDNRVDDGERFILMVDVDEVIYSCKDIDNAVCGFKSYKDVVEIFDKEIALKMYADALKEAYSSDKCTITSISSKYDP